MNFLDTYDITAGTSTPPGNNQSEQSLNEEVTQVIGQLGRFWGGFRKQSQAAFENARKELTKLTTEAPASAEPLSSNSTSEDTDEAETGTSSDAERTPSSPTPTVRDAPTSPSASIQNVFARLQSSLPPNIVATVQNNIPESIRHASESIDLTQLRSTLTTEFQRVQGVTRAQAEEYMHKTEGMLKEAMKEASEVLKDAVKVIPPEEGGASSSGLVWDGSDVWMFPSPIPGTPDNSGSSKGKGKESVDSRRQSTDSQRAVATRAESLLKQLRHNPEIIRADPEASDAAGELYNTWLQEYVDSQEGGLESANWSDKISGELDDSADGKALQATYDALVPSQMTEEVLWKRYFFRVYQIEREEERRKALLQQTIHAEEEDFAWEDEDEEASPVSPKTTPSQTITSQQTLVPEGPTSCTTTPVTLSPPESSEESYDVVSGNVSEKHAKEEEEEEDSDWE